MTASLNSVLTVLIPVALVAFLLLRRFQLLVGPQLLDQRGRRRLVTRSIILSVIAALILFAPHPFSGYMGALSGALLGTGLAYWSARHTRFETNTDGQALRYVPHAWIGGGVFALFVLRLLWRLWPFLNGQVQVGTPGHTAQGFDPAAFAGSSPLTTALFMLFVGYQIVYALLILRRAQPAQFFGKGGTS